MPALEGLTINHLRSRVTRTGPVLVHGSPWHFSETPAQIGIARELGAHNDEILTRIGYTTVQIDDLRERKII